GKAKDALDGGTIGQQIPLLGSNLAGGSRMLGELDDFLDRVRGVTAAAESAASASSVKSAVAGFLTQALGPDGLDVLKGAVTVKVMCGPVECEGPETPPFFTDVAIRLSIGRDAIAETPGFTLGVPGLRLSSEDRLKASVGWRLDL